MFASSGYKCTALRRETQGHHAELRDRMSAFTRSLLDTPPAIPGLDESIVISPRRLHITLGVMSLADADSSPRPQSARRAPADAAQGQASGSKPEVAPKTVDDALRLLAELKPRIKDLLAGEPLRVALRHVDIMKPDRGDLARAHVMWAGPPKDGADAVRLRRVAGRSFLVTKQQQAWC